MFIKYDLIANEGHLSEFDRALRYVLSNDTITMEIDIRREIAQQSGSPATRRMLASVAPILGWPVAWNARAPELVLPANRGLSGVANAANFATSVLQDLSDRLRLLGVSVQLARPGTFGVRRMVYGDPRSLVARQVAGNPPVLRFSFYPRDDAQVLTAKHLGQPLVDEVSFLVVLGATGVITNPGYTPVYLFRESRIAILDDCLLQVRQEWASREREGPFNPEAGVAGPYALRSYRGGAGTARFRYKYARDASHVLCPFPSTDSYTLQGLYSNLSEVLRYWTTLLVAENEGLESRNSRSNAVSFPTAGRAGFINKSTARMALEMPGQIHKRLDTTLSTQAMRVLTNELDVEIDATAAVTAERRMSVAPEVCEAQIQLLCELAGVPAVEVSDAR